MSRRAAVTLAIVVAAIAGIVILLVSSAGPGGPGGPEDPGSVAEAPGDVVVEEGPEPPGETALADVIEADVVRRGSAIVFRARMAGEIPQRVKGGGMSWRWDVYEGQTGTWILSASLDIGPVASLTHTQSNYGSSTFDDRLPGEMSIDGDTITITLRPKKLEDWPDDFEWVLGTTLDGEQGNPRSALATDTAPDEGRGQVEG